MTTSHTIESIQEAALSLQPDARVALAHTLVESLGTLTESELSDLWLREAQRRDQEMDAGNVQGIAGNEVFVDIKKRHTK